MGDMNYLDAGMSMTEEQQSMPLRDAVFISLRKAILTGKLKPGERLTEVKLGKLLGRNICVEIVCSPMIKNIALRYAVIFFADIALYPLLFDRIGGKSGQAA